ncbi:MAG: PilN domain-containing protein [Candidatus Nealsonbacteria bacterium]|nr:PilN domain-containing protein [Candidatus Nealsonbacteria bacterium]
MTNLLPEQYKKELIEEKNRKLVLILVILFSFFLFCFSLFLFLIKFQQENEIEFQKNLLSLKKEEFLQIHNLEEKFNLTNQKLSQLNAFYQKKFSLTQFLEQIYQIIPPGIRLDSFSYQAEDGQVNLSGLAPTIELLVDFKNNLKEQKNLKEISFPSFVWIELTDIDFSVSFKTIDNLHGSE